MFSIGWGKDENLNYSDALKYNNMDIYKATVPNGSIIRAGYMNPVSKKYSTTCYGDSGGPLVANGNKSILLGIASYTADNCVGVKPAGFTRVSSYLDWIESAQKLIEAELARRTSFEKIKTPEIKIEFVGQTPYINFVENGESKKYVVNCFIDDGDYYGFASASKTVKIANYAVDVAFGCTGQYINSSGKESIPSKQILLKIPKYVAPSYNGWDTRTKPTGPQVATKPTTPQGLPSRESTLPTTSSQNPNKVDSSYIYQSEILGGSYVMYSKSGYYVFEYYNPFSKPSYTLVIGDGYSLYDMYYSGNGMPSFSIKQRITGKTLSCSAELNNIIIANKTYQKLSISQRCLLELYISQLSFRLIENNKYFDIKFVRLAE